MKYIKKTYWSTKKLDLILKKHLKGRKGKEPRISESQVTRELIGKLEKK